MALSDPIHVGDRVEIYLDSKNWGTDSWFTGTVVRVDPYSEHRSFYWVELDAESVVALGRGIKLISVLNPKNIRKTQ